MFHERAGWRLAGQAIILYSFPEFDEGSAQTNAAEQIRATAQFLEDLTNWLDRFTHSIIELKASEEYEKALQASQLPSQRSTH